MSFKPDLVSELEKMARLELSSSEHTALPTQIRSILSYVAILEGVDVSGISALNHINGNSNVMRADKVVENPLKDALASAPSVNNDHFEVPLVIDSESQ